MCEFFSFCSNDEGRPLYFNAEQRREIMEEYKFKRLCYKPDSHTSIAHYYGYLKENEDFLGKYEYNPLTQNFKIDNIGRVDNVKEMKKWVKELDFKTIVPELIIKPIVNPLKIEPPKIEKEQIKLLKQWISVRILIGNPAEDSVGTSDKDLVWTSVGASVLALVGDSVWTSVEASVWASVRDLVEASVLASVRDSVWASVRNSVEDSVWAYCSSFFNIKFAYDFSSAIKLWEQGFVPYFDGKFWYLFSKKGIEWKGK